jgi:hypothetical protein
MLNQLDRKTIIIVLLYVLLLIFLYINIGAIIYKSDVDKTIQNYSWIFFGISTLFAIICIWVLTHVNDMKTSRYFMASMFVMYSLLVPIFVLSKPDASQDLYIVSTTYAKTIAFLFTNIFIGFYLFGKTEFSISPLSPIITASST